MAAAVTESPTDPAPSEAPSRPAGHGAASGHEPFLRRRRRAGRDPLGFRAGRARTWFYLGGGALLLVVAVPLAAPGWSAPIERLATLLSLVFLVAAIGLWLGMRGRAFAVSASLVLGLYALTFWTRLAFPLQDFFVLAVLVSFAIFALAGFNLVFLLEEVVFDTHAHLHLRGRAWELAPTALCMALTIGLPAWRWSGGPSLPALWWAAVAGSLLLLFWWTVAWAHQVRSAAVLRELHLFVVGALAATALADGVRVLGAAEALPRLLPSLIAYLTIIGTWVYASYTTLQRTHFLLRGDNWRPWVAIVLGASFAVVAHSQVLVAESGSRALTDLVDLRFGYLVAGVWLGIGFYAARGLSRVASFVRSTGGIGPLSARVADRAGRLAGGLAGTERILEGAALAVFRRLDTVLPGEHQPPRPLPARAAAPPGEGGPAGPGDGWRTMRRKLD